MTDLESKKVEDFGPEDYEDFLENISKTTTEGGNSE
jgi:cyclopropane fatty-acyl-phospholipid synthase-like methyltransferase